MLHAQFEIQSNIKTPFIHSKADVWKIIKLKAKFTLSPALQRPIRIIRLILLILTNPCVGEPDIRCYFLSLHMKQFDPRIDPLNGDSQKMKGSKQYKMCLYFSPFLDSSVPDWCGIKCLAFFFFYTFTNIKKKSNFEIKIIYLYKELALFSTIKKNCIFRFVT